MEHQEDVTSIEGQAQKIVSAWHDLVRLAPRMKVALPESVARFQAHVDELHLEGGHRRVTDHDLFYRISAALDRAEHPMAMSELSEALGVPPNTATRTVDWLVKAGYAERLPDRDDRRVVRVGLTQEGRELHHALSNFALTHTVDLLRRFTPEEREWLVVLLRKLAGVLKEEPPLS